MTPFGTSKKLPSSEENFSSEQKENEQKENERSMSKQAIAGIILENKQLIQAAAVDLANLDVEQVEENLLETAEANPELMQNDSFKKLIANVYVLQALRRGQFSREIIKQEGTRYLYDFYGNINPNRWENRSDYFLLINGKGPVFISQDMANNFKYRPQEAVDFQIRIFNKIVEEELGINCKNAFETSHRYVTPEQQKIMKELIAEAQKLGNWYQLSQANLQNDLQEKGQNFVLQESLLMDKISEYETSKASLEEKLRMGPTGYRIFSSPEEPFFSPKWSSEQRQIFVRLLDEELSIELKTIEQVEKKIAILEEISFEIEEPQRAAVKRQEELQASQYQERLARQLAQSETPEGQSALIERMNQRGAIHLGLISFRGPLYGVREDKKWRMFVINKETGVFEAFRGPHSTTRASTIKNLKATLKDLGFEEEGPVESAHLQKINAALTTEEKIPKAQKQKVLPNNNPFADLLKKRR